LREENKMTTVVEKNDAKLDDDAWTLLEYFAQMEKIVENMQNDSLFVKCFPNMEVKLDNLKYRIKEAVKEVEIQIEWY